MERNQFPSFVSLFPPPRLGKSNKSSIGRPTDPFNVGGREVGRWCWALFAC